MSEGHKDGGHIYYAHSRNEQGVRHVLAVHLEAVAALAAGFARIFGGQDIARLVSLWHDVGKFDPAFQEYLRVCEWADAHGGPKPPHGPDHKGAGACLAADPEYLPMVAALVQGHHGGLHDGADLRNFLQKRSKDPAVAVAIATARGVLPAIDSARPVVVPDWLMDEQVDNATMNRRLEFFLRMIFSALVDADCLDTEAHFTPRKTAARAVPVTIAELWERFQRKQEAFVQAVEQKQQGPRTPKQKQVHRVRQRVYDACVAAASLPPGLFRLTAPTGAGKTRASMAFALRHAQKYGMERVIVAVPYISITEQTAGSYRTALAEVEGAPTEQMAAQYRQILGANVVLEHHSALDLGERWPAKLVAQNWDARIVVSTTVQFFESLFGARTTKCRRIHNIANSVVILDEVQSLPLHLLETLLDGLRELCAHYHTTVVLCTATQPTFEVIPALSDLQAREIVPDVAECFAALKRVEYDIRLAQPMQWSEVAALMRSEQQCMAIVNTKRTARKLMAALADPEALHLSTWMCAAHRRVVLAEIRRRLEAGEPCRVVATQVIEAGVDVDFPLVLRALGPLERIPQAAGRCNREGKLECGRVIVFEPADQRLPAGDYETATGLAGMLLRSGITDLDNPEVHAQYYRLLLQRVDTDREGLQATRALTEEYATVAQRCRLIDEPTYSLIITDYGSPEERAQVAQWVKAIRDGDQDTRTLLRKVQPYVVPILVWEAWDHHDMGMISPLGDKVGVGEIGVWTQGAYHDTVGILLLS